jgi:hypothetical protein
LKNNVITQDLGYCGVICSICKNLEDNCKGCIDHGGDMNCYQRICCIDKNIDGCWQCNTYPCKKGYFVDEEGMGLCLGFVSCIKKKGINFFFMISKTEIGKEN